MGMAKEILKEKANVTVTVTDWGKHFLMVKVMGWDSVKAKETCLAMGMDLVMVKHSEMVRVRVKQTLTVTTMV